MGVYRVRAGTVEDQDGFWVKCEKFVAFAPSWHQVGDKVAIFQQNERE